MAGIMTAAESIFFFSVMPMKTTIFVELARIFLIKGFFLLKRCVLPKLKHFMEALVIAKGFFWQEDL